MVSGVPRAMTPFMGGAGRTPSPSPFPAVSLLQANEGNAGVPNRAHRGKERDGAVPRGPLRDADMDGREGGNACDVSLAAPGAVASGAR